MIYPSDVDPEKLTPEQIYQMALDRGHKKGYEKGKGEFHVLSYLVGNIGGIVTVVIGYFIGGLA